MNTNVWFATVLISQMYKVEKPLEESMNEKNKYLWT